MRPATEKEFPKVIEFANKCFNIDFKIAEPKVYLHKELARNNFICERDGKIVGLIAIYPFKYNGLEFVGVGTVCVDPDYRNQGIMQEMFKYLDKEVFPKYDIAYLHGIRDRYEHFDFFKTGERIRYGIRKAKSFTPKYHFTRSEFKNDLFKFYTQDVSREKKYFKDILSTHKNVVYEIYDKDTLVGYLVYRESQNTILEIMVGSDVNFRDIINDFCVHIERISVEYIAKVDNTVFMDECESYSIQQLVNFKIINAKKVLEQVILHSPNLCDGQTKFTVEKFGTLVVSVQNGIVEVTTEDAIASDYYTLKQFTKMLFERITNDSYIKLSPLLKQWLPMVLPATIYEIDCF